MAMPQKVQNNCGKPVRCVWRTRLFVNTALKRPIRRRQKFILAAPPHIPQKNMAVPYYEINNKFISVIALNVKKLTKNTFR